VEGTSFKMDFLSSGTVRTDPLMFSQNGECLSDHVHRFYGAASEKTMRPGVSYADLRNASGNTGNVEENKSLYWNPAIYKVVNQNGAKTYEIVDVWFASAYYVWRTGQATSFPDGLKMKTSGSEEVARARSVCDGDYPCERTDAGGCDAYAPSNQQAGGFLPLTGCSELEMNIKFPTCWDGVNLEAQNGVKHVVFATDCNGNEHNECFDFDCPSSHPVRMPELHLYVRVQDYQGGAHVFADGTNVFHSDYFSGWEATKLQHVLDNCDNDSEAAMPNAYCSDFLTFRGKGKTEGVQVDDFEIEADLKTYQPDPIDIKGTISAEDVSGVPNIPSGVCNGELIGASSSGNTSPPSPSPTPSPAPTTSSYVTTCAAKGKTRKVVKVSKGKVYTFDTNKASKYGPNVNCLATYKRTSKCKTMKLSCSKFSLAGGDSLRVIRGKNRKTYKGSSRPSLSTSAKTMKLFFKSNRKAHGAGATCNVTCV